MTRKDYEKIAEVIADRAEMAREGDGAMWSPEFVLRTLVMKLAIVFEEENPRFDAGRFGVACGFADQFGTVTK